MIKCIEIKNLKSLKSVMMDTLPLNLLMGINGMGKSSFIQSLLLLRQNRGSGLAKIALNGEYTEIGRGRDALYQDAIDETINIKMEMSVADGGAISLPCSLAYKADSNVLDNDVSFPIDILDRYPLFNNNFQYLEAVRTGPCTDYPMSYADVFERHQLGLRGEYAIHYLNVFGSEKVPLSLRHPKAKSEMLLHQTAAWLGEISPDVRFEIQEISGTDKVVLNYQFANHDMVGNRFRPKNVGFGISYVLPVIVALLSYSEDKVIIIENPEAHIHPKGQAQMGKLIALAANEGMQLFVETHSDHIVNGIRVAVKERLIPNTKVNISYFYRKSTREEQFCDIDSITVDINGELSEYPEDFMDEWNNQLLKLV